MDYKEIIQQNIKEFKENKIWYRIVSDNSGHDYVIPVEKSKEWNTFMEIPEDDERSWDVPDFAIKIEGGLVFSAWKEDFTL